MYCFLLQYSYCYTGTTHPQRIPPGCFTYKNSWLLLVSTSVKCYLCRLRRILWAIVFILPLNILTSELFCFLAVWPFVSLWLFYIGTMVHMDINKLQSEYEIKMHYTKPMHFMSNFWVFGILQWDRYCDVIFRLPLALNVHLINEEDYREKGSTLRCCTIAPPTYNSAFYSV